MGPTTLVLRVTHSFINQPSMPHHDLPEWAWHQIQLQRCWTHWWRVAPIGHSWWTYVSAVSAHLEWFFWPRWWRPYNTVPAGGTAFTSTGLHSSSVYPARADGAFFLATHASPVHVITTTSSTNQTTHNQRVIRISVRVRRWLGWNTNCCAPTPPSFGFAPSNRSLKHRYINMPSDILEFN